MGEFITDSGQRIINVHEPEACAGEYCVIHNPSPHHMRDWKLCWRDDKRQFERICEHGCGHPDPDDLAHKERVLGKEMAAHFAIHGCDGCCCKLQK